MTDPRPDLVRDATRRYRRRHPLRYVAKRLRDLRALIRRVLVVEWRRRFR